MRTLTLAAALLPLLAACLDAGTIPCGERVCPAGTACLEIADEQRCIDGDLVRACNGLAPGADCELAGISGQCRDGVCAVSSCGDGVIDAGEACDDGNVASGDGCRADCQGLERCGDGFRDVTESCDCGDDPGALPAGCATPNDDDAAAQCDRSCSRYCGDATITGGEQCDGTALGEVTCDDLGYYAGELACSPQCVFDASACAGSCGDGAVQAGEEECDGAPPVGSCLDFGLDLGHLGCSSRCSARVREDCDRFGWEPQSATTSAWTDGELTALVYNGGDGGVVVLADGTAIGVPSPGASHVAGRDGVVWFVGEVTGTRWEAGVTTTFGMPNVGAALEINDVAVDAAGTLTMLTQFPCQLWELDGATWQARGDAFDSYCSGRGATDGTVAVFEYESGLVRFWDGTTLADVDLNGTLADVEIVDERPALATSTGLYVDGTLVRSGNYVSVAAAGDFLAGSRTSAAVIDRYDGRSWVEVPAPAVGDLTLGPDGSMVLRNPGFFGATFRLTTGAWWDDGAVGGALGSASTAVAHPPDGTIIAGNNIAVHAGSGWQVAAPARGASSVWAATIDRIWIVSGSVLRRYDDVDLTTSVPVAGPWGANPVTRVSGDPDGTLALLAGNTLYRDAVGLAPASPAPIGCTFTNLAGGVAPRLYVVGACVGEAVLWQHDGVGLVERYRAAGVTLGAVTVTSDGGATAIGTLTVRVELAASPAMTFEGAGTSIAGTESNDLFALRANTPGLGVNRLMHWDGVTWAPVRTPSDTAWTHLAVGTDDVIVTRPGQAARLVRVGVHGGM